MRYFFLVLFVSGFAGGAFAQGLGFGAIKADAKAPIEAEADSMTVLEAENAAELVGGVEISQGGTRLTANRVKVFYASDNAGISQLLATGAVVLMSGADRATADSADYDLNRGTIRLTGNVSVRQSGNSLTAQTIDIDLDTGEAVMSGRVRTILSPGSN